MTEEIAKQRMNKTRFFKSSTVPTDLLSSKPETNEVEVQGRRTLYGTLPFFSAFGMQARETGFRRVIKTASCNTLQALPRQDEEVFKKLFLIIILFMIVNINYDITETKNLI
jgi:hypothetical protein